MTKKVNLKELLERVIKISESTGSRYQTVEVYSSIQNGEKSQGIRIYVESVGWFFGRNEDDCISKLSEAIAGGKREIEEVEIPQEIKDALNETLRD